jgi:hypothetical protein
VSTVVSHVATEGVMPVVGAAAMFEAARAKNACDAAQDQRTGAEPPTEPAPVRVMLADAVVARLTSSKESPHLRNIITLTASTDRSHGPFIHELRRIESRHINIADKYSRRCTVCR